jgi:hypothetical protein
MLAIAAQHSGKALTGTGCHDHGSHEQNSSTYTYNSHVLLIWLMVIVLSLPLLIDSIFIADPQGQADCLV